MLRLLGILALCVACGAALKPPALAADQSAVEFATTAPGDTSAEVAVRVSNPGGSPTTAVVTGLAGWDPGAFVVTSDGCAGTALANAASCEIRLVFRPSEQRQFAAELRIAAGPAAATISVAGRAEDTARLSISKMAHSFAGVDLGRSATTFLTISNPGSHATSPLSMDAAGDTGSFIVGGNCIGRALAPAGSCDLQVTFSPQSLGAKALSLVVLGSRYATVRSTFDGYGKRLVTLTVTTEGDGVVGVSGSADSCVAQPCRVRFEIGGPTARASLIARPGTKSLFAEWVGGCSGSSLSCEMSIDGDRSVLAKFAPAVTLSVDAQVLAGGQGLVEMTPGSSCQAPCRPTALVRRGSPVRLVATAGSQSQFRWTGACRGTAAICELPGDADAETGVVFNGANYVFVTSQAYPTNLGLAAYDAACNERAAAAGLPGPYAAWLSTKAAPAWSRMASSRGFIRVDGRPFADILAPGGAIYFPPSLDEFGRVRDEYVRLAMTGTDYFGNTDPERNCSDWTVTGNDSLKLGDPLTGTGTWTGWAWGGCTIRWLVYCMGTAIQRPLQREPATGRLAFVSFRAIPSGGGIAAADSHCGTEARAAGLKGSFKALLAVEGASATGRFDLGGPRWVRPDGVPIVEKAADLSKGNLIAPIDEYASGTYDFQFNLVWAGARVQSGVGTAANTCASWTSTASALRTSAASDVTTEVNWFGTGDVPCDVWGRVICLQE